MEQPNEEYEEYSVYVEGLEEKPYATCLVKKERASEETLERKYL